MLDSLYTEAIKKKGTIKENVEDLSQTNLDVSKYWNGGEIAISNENFTIAAGDGSLNKKKYLSFNFYAIAAVSLIYGDSFETIESLEVDTIPHQSFVDDRLRNMMSLFEIENAIKSINSYDVDYYLDDGSLLGDLIRPFPLEKKLSSSKKEEIINIVEEKLKKEVETFEDGISSLNFKEKFKELYENSDFDEDNLTIFLENIEKLLALSYFLKYNKKIIAISKTSSGTDIFNGNIPDIAIFDKFDKGEGYSEPYYKKVSSEMKHEFPVEDNFFRTLEFTIFYARLKENKNVIKIELPYHAKDSEIQKILGILKKDSTEGYPYLLKKAHHSVVIKKKNIEELSKIVGFIEKSGREML